MSTYRAKYKTIASYVLFKLPKRLTRGDKAKVTRYYNRIAKAKAKGFVIIKTKDDGRQHLANRAQGIKGMPALKIALVRKPGDGFRVSVAKDGTIKSTNKKSGITKVTIEAQFFIAGEVLKGEAEAEAKRLLILAKRSLGKKPQRCAIAYYGGENAWSDTSMLSELLVVDNAKYGNTIGFPADAINFYLVRQSKKVLAIQNQLRDERKRASERRKAKRRASDV